MAGTLSHVSRSALSGMAVLGLAVAVAGGAHAATIYDATGGVEAGGDVIDPNALPPGTGVGPIVADRFLNSVADTLSSVTLNLELSGPPLTGFTVDLWPDFFGQPVGPETQIALVSDSSLTSSFALYTYTPSARSRWPQTISAS